ncbi:3'-5' exonuclease [Sulfurimonas sp. SAG-AH-194-C21]|nr:exonuclease domain-containing protein [Sulfurimonas sp. SAG-AH-194-C21]MDF1884276.1 3'-5' exonuclease [Sulfurimonas sp. SAG-AH-194-C21]
MLIFLDTETTGLETKDVICSVAFIDDDTYGYELINEGKKISAEASSVHHITNEMIKDKLAFKKSSVYKYLQEHNTDENTLVAHNINFDLGMMASAGFIWKGCIIDTLRVSKHLIQECEGFSLQLLRYELKLYRGEEKLKNQYGIKDALLANNALSDAFVTKLLFGYLEEMVSVEEMHTLSFKEVLLAKFSFGKHKGKYIEEVCINDTSYAQWLLSSDTDEDIKYSINYYLQGNV